MWFSGDPGAFILMNPQLKYLIELQKIDSEIAELEKSQARIPKQIEAGKSDLQERQNRLKAAQDDISEMQKKTERSGAGCGDRERSYCQNQDETSIGQN